MQQIKYNNNNLEIFNNTSRKITNSDKEKFKEWIAEYRLAVSDKKNSQKLFLETGQRMFQWLNSADSTFTRFLNNTKQTPLIIEFEVPTQPNEDELLFLELPWEIIANEKGFLASQPGIAYCPVRRIGQPQAPKDPEPYKLSLVFLAAAPKETTVHLQFEQEETAILDATEQVGLDLTVEESGSLEGLCRTMSFEKPVDVIHISCHGSYGDGEPLLVLENEMGLQDLKNPEKIASSLGTNKPELLFLSACKTSEPDNFLNTFSSKMIRWAIPSVLGWGGSVSDMEATRFASKLYKKLVLTEPLQNAVAWSRFELLNPEPNEPQSKDWHLARLYLGASGGGKICGGQQTRKKKDADRVYKEYLNEKDKTVPVAGRREFVGRRRPIQKILREFNKKEKAGVLIHGFGRQGKSSLAARIASRLDRHIPVVIFGNYDAKYILDAIVDSLRTKSVKDIADKYKDDINTTPADLEYALMEILEGPCSQLPPEFKNSEQRLNQPIFLIIDDFEQALNPLEDSLNIIKPEYVESIRAVISAFSSASTASRLLFTSRFQFTLPHARRNRDLKDEFLSIHLPAMEYYEGRKQAFAKASVSKNAKYVPELWRTRRCVEIARGNPGLQDLLFSMSQENPESCDKALESMENYIKSRKEPDQEELLSFIENLAIKEFFKILSKNEKELLRISTLFQTPIPLEILKIIANELSLNNSESTGYRLFALGLLEKLEDPVQTNTDAFCLNAIFRSHAGHLSKDETIFFSKMILKDLFEKWGGANTYKPMHANYELARLACHAKNTDILTSTGDLAIEWLEEQNRAKEATQLAIDSVNIFDESKVEVPPVMLLNAARPIVNSGNIEKAVHLLERAQKGFEKLGDQRSRAVTLGDIARIKVDRGDVDEALRLHEEMLRVFEELGDQRERAVTLGYIARIKVSRGDVDEALRLHEERFRVFEELGDQRERAVTLGDVAQIKLQQGKVQEGFEHLKESYDICIHLGAVDGISFVGTSYGQLLCQAGYKDEGLKILQRSKDGFIKLRQVDMARQVEEVMKGI